MPGGSDARCHWGRRSARLGLGLPSCVGVSEDGDAFAASAAVAKRTAALLRDARSVQRRLDTLAATAMAMEDPSLDRIAEAREAVQRLVLELGYRERGEQRRAKAAVRGIR